MKIKFDTSKTYAFALEGGGARGAYQAGAIKALLENGVKYNAVSGTSVGALNGAIMAMKRPELAEEIWQDMDFSRVLKTETDLLSTMFSSGILELEVKNIKSGLKNFFKEKGFDISPLKSLIKEKVDPKKIKESGIKFFISTFSITDRKELNLEAVNLEDNELLDMLLASSYLPVFKNDLLGGKRYTDGAVTNVIPISPLIKAGFTDIIAIRLNSPGVEKRVKIPKGTTVTELSPNRELGSLLNFSKEHCQSLFTLGYFDALKLLFGLFGKTYYIDRTLSEEEAFNILFKAVALKEPLKDQSLRAKHKAVSRFCREYSTKGDYYDVLIALIEEKAEKEEIEPLKIYTDLSILAQIGLVEI